MLFLLAYNSLY